MGTLVFASIAIFAAAARASEDVKRFLDKARQSQGPAPVRSGETQSGTRKIDPAMARALQGSEGLYEGVKRDLDEPGLVEMEANFSGDQIDFRIKYLKPKHGRRVLEDRFRLRDFRLASAKETEILIKELASMKLSAERVVILHSKKAGDLDLVFVRDPQPGQYGLLILYPSNRASEALFLFSPAQIQRGELRAYRSRLGG